MLTRLLADLLDLIYPRTCTGCNQPLIGDEDQLCFKCLLSLPRTDFHKFQKNEVSRIFLGRIRMQRASAYLYFQKGGIVQSIMHHLKYQNSPETAVFMGELMGREMNGSLFMGDIDLIIPVPLHIQKRRKRGYNQSEMIARGLATETSIAMDPENLTRVTATSSQTRKSRFERWLNVESIFKVKEPHKLENTHILLIDDVITTGSTVEACAWELSKIKGVSISFLALAIAR